MARRLVPVVNCDGCSTDLDPLTQSDAVAVTFTGHEMTWIADFCDPCRGLAQEALRTQLIELAFSDYVPTPKKARVRKPAGAPVRVRKPSPYEAGMDCPECGRRSASRGALRQHIQNKHGKSITDYNI